MEEIVVENCIPITDKGVCAIATQCTAITKIILTACIHITDISILCIAKQKHCSQLQYISLDKCTQITDYAMSILYNNCKNLIAFSKQFTELSDSILIQMSENSHSLTITMDSKKLENFSVDVVHYTAGNDTECYLYDEKCSNFTMITMSLISPQLVCIKLCKLPTLTNEVVVAFIENCVHLEEITLNRNDLLTADVLYPKITQHCIYLTSIRTIKLSGLTDELLSTLLTTRGEQLKLLDIDCSPLSTDVSMELIAVHCSDNLTLLDISSNKLITDTSILKIIRSCERLRTLHLDYCDQLTNAVLEEICLFNTTITTLTITKCAKITALNCAKFLKNCSSNLENFYFTDELWVGDYE